MVDGLVSIIIVTCNNKDFVQKCLDSLTKQSYKQLEIILINNSSEDNFVNWLKQSYPDIRIIAQKENLLFCAAHNRGIAESQGEYVFCLNDDVILEEDFIKRAVEAMQKDNGIGMVSGKIMRMDKKTIDSAGLFLARSRIPKERGFGEIDSGQYENPGYVFGVSGAAGFYRRQMLEDIRINGEYFDADYGIFYEDLDLCWRANRFGWKAYYTPKAVAFHLRGGTVKKNPPRIGFIEKYNFAYLPTGLQAHLIKNRYMTIIKNDSLKALLLNFPCIVWYDIKLWSYILIFKPQLILITFKNMKYFLRAFKKRNAIFARLKLSAPKVEKKIDFYISL